LGENRRGSYAAGWQAGKFLMGAAQQCCGTETKDNQRDREHDGHKQETNTREHEFLFRLRETLRRLLNQGNAVTTL
jgi:hypothetical protein